MVMVQSAVFSDRMMLPLYLSDAIAHYLVYIHVPVQYCTLIACSTGTPVPASQVLVPGGTVPHTVRFERGK